MTRTLTLLLLATGCAAPALPAPSGAEAAPSAVDTSTATPPQLALAERPSAPPSLKPAAVPSGWPPPCPETNKGHVAGHVLVAFKDGATEAERAKFRQAFEVLAERSLLLPGVWVMRVSCDADIPAVAKQMAAWPGVRYAEPDAVITLDDPIESR